jgi:PIN domain nuclease of toxin-antitoxin system
MRKPVLLDTCAAIWLMNGDPMTQESRRAIQTAQKQSLGVYVSPISAWEIGTLVTKRGLQLSMAADAWFELLLSLPGVRLAEMPPKVLIAAAYLPGIAPKDPADRIIAATAREYGLTVLTRDQELIPYAEAGRLSAVRC